MLTTLDNLLNKITMYKLVHWGLRILAVIAFIFSAFQVLHLSFWGMAISLALLAVVSQAASMLMARIWKIPANTESFGITLLILFFLLPPVKSVTDGGIIVLAAIIAQVSKYIITVHNRHIFNPAAFSAVAVGLIGLTTPIWWVGSKPLWPFTLILALLVVRKIRRFSLFLTYIFVALAAMALGAIVHHQDIALNLRFAITSSPLLFLGGIMLTEPATMPSHRRQQVIFGALVAILYGFPWNFGALHIYPETALIIGNLYAFFGNPHYRMKLRLREVQKFSDRVWSYAFTPDRKPGFVPGQYMEWTLGMPNHDGRGNRRTFSIASSPTEKDIQMGVKFYEPSSRFKQELKGLKPDAVLYAGQIAGDFTMPIDKHQKLAFIAGGIGITPFRSMLKYVVDMHETRDIVLIYAVSDPSELAFGDVLGEAEAHGIRVIKLLTKDKVPATWKGTTGQLTEAFITQQISDHKDRIFYLSGPQPMVAGLRKTIQKVGAKKIKTDYFTGY
jgi:ferredoxin-NADP reductase/Na+-transporting NADH:ubiquinone oxidoreductase subunit NqrB